MFFLAVKLPIVPLRTWLPNHALTYLFFYELDLCNNYINAHLLDEIQNESPIYNKRKQITVSSHFSIEKVCSKRMCTAKCRNMFEYFCWLFFEVIFMSTYIVVGFAIASKRTIIFKDRGMFSILKNDTQDHTQHRLFFLFLFFI